MTSLILALNVRSCPLKGTWPAVANVFWVPAEALPWFWSPGLKLVHLVFDVATKVFDHLMNEMYAYGI